MLEYKDNELVNEAINKYKDDITAKLASVNLQISRCNKYVDDFDSNVKTVKNMAIFGPIVGTIVLTIVESLLMGGIVGLKFILLNVAIFVAVLEPILIHEINSMKQIKSNIQAKKLPDLTIKKSEYIDLLENIYKYLSNNKKEDSNNHSNGIAPIDRTYESNNAKKRELNK